MQFLPFSICAHTADIKQIYDLGSKRKREGHRLPQQVCAIVEQS